MLKIIVKLFDSSEAEHVCVVLILELEIKTCNPNDCASCVSVFCLFFGNSVCADNLIKVCFTDRKMHKKSNICVEVILQGLTPIHPELLRAETVGATPGLTCHFVLNPNKSLSAKT